MNLVMFLLIFTVAFKLNPAWADDRFDKFLKTKNPNKYDVLGISRSPEDTLLDRARAAARPLQKTFHPDKFRDAPIDVQARNSRILNMINVAINQIKTDIQGGQGYVDANGVALGPDVSDRVPIAEMLASEFRREIRELDAEQKFGDKLESLNLKELRARYAEAKSYYKKSRSSKGQAGPNPAPAESAEEERLRDVETAANQKLNATAEDSKSQATNRYRVLFEEKVQRSKDRYRHLTVAETVTIREMFNFWANVIQENIKSQNFQNADPSTRIAIANGIMAALSDSLYENDLGELSRYLSLSTVTNLLDALEAMMAKLPGTTIANVVHRHPSSTENKDNLLIWLPKALDLRMQASPNLRDSGAAIATKMRVESLKAGNELSIESLASLLNAEFDAFSANHWIRGPMPFTKLEIMLGILDHIYAPPTPDHLEHKAKLTMALLKVAPQQLGNPTDRYVLSEAILAKLQDDPRNEMNLVRAEASAIFNSSSEPGRCDRFFRTIYQMLAMTRATKLSK